MRFRWAAIAVLFFVTTVTGSAGASFPVSPYEPALINGSSRRAAAGDGAGGMFVTWQTFVAPCRNTFCPDTFRVSLQHISAGFGPAPGWPLAGKPVSTHPASQTQGVVAPDGSGGAFVAWRDERDTSSRIYCQRYGADGNLAAGWPATGVQLSGQFNFDRSPLICADGAGGAFVVWTDQSASTLFGQHVNEAGQIVAGWPAAGRILCQAPGANANPDLCPDGAGGFYVAWEDTRTGGQPDLYVLRVAADGTLAPGWIVNGNAASTAIGWQRLPQLCTDGSGGVIVTWMDERNDPNDIYALRVLGDGTVAPGWTSGGTAICEAAGGQWNPAIASDEAGGAIVAWYDKRDFPSVTATYAVRVTGAGTIASGWPIDGVLVSVGRSDSYTTVVLDGAQGAYVIWQDDPEIFVQHLAGDGTVASGWPPGGLEVDDNGFAGGQNPIAAAADSAGGAFLVWAGGGVRAAHVSSEGTVVVGVPTEVASAAGIRLSIRSLNPGRGDFRVQLALPAQEPANITLLDVTGRTIWQQAVDIGAPGVPQSFAIPTRSATPGLYWIRVTQGQRSVSRRIAILR